MFFFNTYAHLNEKIVHLFCELTKVKLFNCNWNGIIDSYSIYDKYFIKFCNYLNHFRLYLHFVVYHDIHAWIPNMQWFGIQYPLAITHTKINNYSFPNGLLLRSSHFQTVCLILITLAPPIFKHIHFYFINISYMFRWEKTKSMYFTRKAINFVINNFIVVIKIWNSKRVSNFNWIFI
jgi:hypothetical protein